MKLELKQQLVKTLDFLKNYQNIDNLTLKEIQERMIEYEALLIEFVEKLLEDKEDENGTLTTWWLYDRCPKQLWETTDTSLTTINVESPEDFVNYMIERNDNATVS